MGEIATPAAGHQNFFAGLIGVIQHQHPFAKVASGCGAHQTRGAGADYDEITGLGHSGYLELGAIVIEQWVRVPTFAESVSPHRLFAAKRLAFGLPADTGAPFFQGQSNETFKPNLHRSYRSHDYCLRRRHLDGDQCARYGTCTT